MALSYERGTPVGVVTQGDPAVVSQSSSRSGGAEVAENPLGHFPEKLTTLSEIESPRTETTSVNFGPGTEPTSVQNESTSVQVGPRTVPTSDHVPWFRKRRGRKWKRGAKRGAERGGEMDAQREVEKEGKGRERQRGTERGVERGGEMVAQREVEIGDPARAM